MAAYRADRQAHGRGDCSHAHQERELFPQRAADILGNGGVEPGLSAPFEQALSALRAPSVVLAEYDPLDRAGVLDHAGARDSGPHVGDAPHQRLPADDGPQDVVLDHAVLERDHAGLGADERQHLARSRLGIPELDRENNDIDRPQRCRVVGRPHLAQVHVLDLAFELEAVLAHRRKVRAARDERDIAARVREARADQAADAAGTHHGYLHGASPASTSATCSTFVLVSPRRRRRPSMLSRQPRSPRTTASAPLAAILAHLRSAIWVEISPNFTAKVPPKPQQVSASFISFSASPGTRASRARGCALTPSSRRPEQESW